MGTLLAAVVATTIAVVAVLAPEGIPVVAVVLGVETLEVVVGCE